jgi:hypothetical protein
MKFATGKKTYDNKTAEEVGTTKFLWLKVDNNLNCKKHIEHIVHKVS